MTRFRRKPYHLRTRQKKHHLLGTLPKLTFADFGNSCALLRKCIWKMIVDNSGLRLTQNTRRLDRVWLAEAEQSRVRKEEGEFLPATQRSGFFLEQGCSHGRVGLAESGEKRRVELVEEKWVAVFQAAQAVSEVVGPFRELQACAETLLDEMIGEVYAG
jgi:hypothetical protein